MTGTKNTTKRCIREKWKVIPLCLLTLMIGVSLVLAGCSRSSARNHRRGLFSRHADVLETTQREELFKAMDAMGIKELYQYFPPGTDSRKITQFINKAESHGISVWMLTGEPEWAISADGEALSEQVVRAIIFGGMQGIVVDVKPELLPEWQTDSAAVMQQFTRMMKKGRNAASEAGLEWVICVRDDFDQFEEFKTLVKDGADAIAVRVGNKDSIAENIDAEAALCSKYGRGLISIYELRDPVGSGLTPEETFYEEGIEAVEASWESLLAEISGKYPKLIFSCAFHECRALQELLRQ